MIPIFVLGLISIISIFSESEGKTNRFSFADSYLDYQSFPMDSSDENSIDTLISDPAEQTLLTDSSLQSDSLFLGESLLLSDSLNTYFSDSLATDTVKIDPLLVDSTARLQQFRNSLNPNYIFQVSQPKRSKFFAYPSTRILQRPVKLDSTGQYVLIMNTRPDGTEEVFMKMPLSQYIDLKLKALRKEEWEKQGGKYEFNDGKTELGDILSDITNIEIPLPSTSFLSIFGPPKISLRINGAVDIRGAWRNETTEGVTASALGNTRNEPDFKQQVQINVAGTIGDKLTISADWNTERTFEYENQLKIKYTGYEDEIIQSIEAGNVSLQTAPLVGGSEALFGIKALFQFGPFSLTALASQKKGEVQEVSVSGGSEKQEFTIRAYEYSTNHYFLDTVYASTSPELNIFNKYYGSTSPTYLTEYQVKDIEVWKTTNAIVNKSKERKANAFIDLPSRNDGDSYSGDYTDPTLTEVPGRSVINTRFIKLTEDIDYTLNQYTGVISFNSQIQKEDAIAVAYRVEGANGADNDLYYGQFLSELSNDTSSVIVLKLVKPANLQPGGDFATAWKLQLKNIYPIGGRDIKEEGFELNIQYQDETGDPKSDYQGTPYVQLFGLDKTNSDGTNDQPDGAFDFNQYTINTATGEIIFPTLQPFGEQFPSALPADRRYQAVYDTLVTFAQQEKTKDKFTITGVYSASATSTFNIGFNVVENSVEVYLGGQKLSQGSDYLVDYNIGQVQILNQNALNPGADLRITYEQNDLFQLASKTLLGFRGIYEINKESHIGFSFLNLNQKTLSDKVRIGEEPLNNTIYGVDFASKFDLPILTKALDNVISTSEMSNLKLAAEYAYISPEPNTKKSTIASDESKSIAYIDDFEGAKRIIPIGISYGQWKDISPPNRVPLHSTDLSAAELRDYKAFSYWFNLLPAVDPVTDIWPERQAARDNNKVTVLDFVYEPSERGRYNTLNPTLSNPALNWGGMMKPLSSTASNLVEENIEFIEFWAQLPIVPEDAKLNIDLGQISEDVIPNGELDSEDLNNNDAIDEGEDTGLDGLFDSAEPGYNATTNPDPSNDNFSYASGSNDYRTINGTEGNATGIESGRFPDTEDLNRNLNLDKINSYFRYTIPLDTLKDSNPFIQGGGGENKGWYLFRIPLKDYTEMVGNPSLTLVQTIRLWISGVSQPVHLRFAEMNLVGNQWRKVLDPPRVTEDDEVMEVTTINIEDNPEYNSPPGVQRERDRSKPDEEVYKNEQSLNLIMRNLEDGDKREIVKYLYKPLDLFNYREMKMFLHGDLYNGRGSVSYYEDEQTYGAEIYFRFGTDTSNYYEYRQPVRKGWNEVKMTFSELTAIKEERANTKEVFRQFLADGSGASYAVKGSPTLTRVSFFIIGIKNPKYVYENDSTKVRPNNFGEPVSGSVWVNELRVLGAEDTPGWAYTASATLKLADLLTVDVNTKQTNPYFHGLSERFGNRIDNKNWGLSVGLDLLKLIPANLQGSNFRVNYSHRESMSKPLYLPGTDVAVSEAAKQAYNSIIDAGLPEEAAQAEADRIRYETQTMSKTDSWALNSFKIVLPTDAWYLRETINNLSMGFNYTITESRNPTTISNEKWLWNANVNYDLDFSAENYFQPIDIPIIGDILGIFTDYKDVKIYFSPKKFSASFTASRNRSYNLPRSENAKANIQRDFTTTRKFGFNWQFTQGGILNLSLNYSADFKSSLTNLLTKQIGVDENDDPILVERSESEIWSDIFGGAFFGTDNNLRQSFDLKASPRLPSIWNIQNYLNISLGYSASYTWKNNLSQETIGRSAGWSNKINAGATIRWKSLWEPLFAEEQDKSSSSFNNSGSRSGRRNTRGRGNDRGETDVDKAIGDNPEQDGEGEQTEGEENSEEGSGFSASKALSLLKAAIKYILVDYDQFRLNFSQSNSLANTGLAGEGTGFNNFWGFNTDYMRGPSRAYMLGLSYDVGPRAPNANLSDNYSQKNSIDFSTSRPLWEGATIDLRWNVGWGITKNTSIETDDNGSVLITSLNSNGTIDRSFLSIPNFLFFNFFNSGIVKVSELYNPEADNPNESLSNAFIEGFETLPLFSKIPFLKDFVKYIPRPNWSITWSGLEKISFLDGIAQRIQIKHAYNSKYAEGWKIDPDGNKQIQTQRISYGFAPLIGISMTFPKILDGNLTGSVQYNTTSNYDLGTTTRNITEGFSKDISFTASYSKSGFELPLFGVSLKNDIEVSLSYTTSENSSVIYEMDDFKEDGTPQDGTTRTSIEPRVKYVMSSRVTLSLFYKRTSVEPKGAARVPPTTTNEAGLEVHISIQ